MKTPRKNNDQDHDVSHGHNNHWETNPNHNNKRLNEKL